MKNVKELMVNTMNVYGKHAPWIFLILTNHDIPKNKATNSAVVETDISYGKSFLEACKINFRSKIYC